MSDMAVQRDLVCFSAMISACEKVAAWLWAVHFFDLLTQEPKAADWNNLFHAIGHPSGLVTPWISLHTGNI